jgi:hypothetical protein
VTFGEFKKGGVWAQQAIFEPLGNAHVRILLLPVSSLRKFKNNI